MYKRHWLEPKVGSFMPIISRLCFVEPWWIILHGNQLSSHQNYLIAVSPKLGQVRVRRVINLVPCMTEGKGHLKRKLGDFPGHPGVKTPSFHRRVLQIESLVWNKILQGMPHCQKKKKKRNLEKSVKTLGTSRARDRENCWRGADK